MKLIDFSYLTNLCLSERDSLAENACNHLNLGNFTQVKQSILALYNGLPQHLKGFLCNAENPQIKENKRLLKQLNQFIALESYS